MRLIKKNEIWKSEINNEKQTATSQSKVNLVIKIEKHIKIVQTKKN